MIHISLFPKTVSRFMISPRLCRQALERAAKKIGMDSGTISVKIIGNNEMRKMNLRWRGIDASTDVLSFAMREGKKIPGSADNNLGDIILNKADINARARHVRVPAHRITTFLIVHGFLHCAGFDHRKNQQRIRMRSLERYACGTFVYYDQS